MATVPALDEFFSKTGLQEAALKPIIEKVEEYLALVTQSNKWIAEINASRAADPTKPGYEDELDKLWAIHAPTDNDMAEVESKYQALRAEAEKLLTQLRDFAKTKVPTPLSEEEAKNARKRVNEAAPAIADARKATAALLTIPESMLQLAKVPVPEGGLITLLPQADSLKSARGRKASSGERAPYATRVGDVLIDGNSTQIDGKGKFAYAAAKLSEMWNAQNVPANKVTAEEIEEAYFAALPGSPEVRSIKSTELPDSHEFEFTKTIKVRNANDDSYTDVPKTAKLTVISVNAIAKDEKKNDTPTEKVEPSAEKVEENKAEVPAPKNESAPAKKATAAPKK
jgi:hypothetical protein